MENWKLDDWIVAITVISLICLIIAFTTRWLFKINTRIKQVEQTNWLLREIAVKLGVDKDQVNKLTSTGQ